MSEAALLLKRPRNGKVVKWNVDHRMQIGSDTVNFFVFYEHDDCTSKHLGWSCMIATPVLNLNNTIPVD
jgi:hypothetical protein